MSRFSRFVSILLLSLFILLCSPYRGVIAQEDGSEPTYAIPSELASLPSMAYQPPLQATHLNDFIPPGAIVIPVAVDLPGGVITPTPPLPLPTLEPPLTPTLPTPLPTSELPNTPAITIEPSLTPTLPSPLPTPCAPPLPCPLRLCPPSPSTAQLPTLSSSTRGSWLS